MKIGDIEITAVSDGSAKLPPAYFVNADWTPHQALIGPDGMVDISLGCFVIRTGDRTVLVDAGIGPIDSPIFKGGALPDRLQAAGVTPADVDDLICTHLHIDHIGWVVREGKPYFPNATVHFGAADWGQFVSGVPESDFTRQAFELLEQEGKTAPIEADGEVVPGISSLHTP